MNSLQPTILLVDSDLGQVAPIADALSQEGFRLMPLVSAVDALTLCRSKNFPVDLVVAKIDATPMCGLQLAEMIEQEQLPVEILLTSQFAKEVLFMLPHFQKFSDKLIEEVESEKIRQRVDGVLKLRRSDYR